MTIRSWARKLFARRGTRPVRKAPGPTSASRLLSHCTMRRTNWLPRIGGVQCTADHPALRVDFDGFPHRNTPGEVTAQTGSQQIQAVPPAATAFRGRAGPIFSH
jgi:hypothetical protein